MEDAMHMKKNVDLTEGTIWKQLLLFCLPIMFGTLFQQLYNAVDVVVVGQFVGADAIASVGGSSGMVINLVVGLFVGLSSGVTIIVSRFYGARDSANVYKGIQTALLLSLIGGVLLTVPGILFTPTMLRLLNTPEEIMASSAAYLRIYFAGIIFVFLYNVGSAILRALGDSRRPLYYLIVCCFINIFLDVILVAFFRLGVAGVAIATVTAQAVSALLTLRALCRLDLGDHQLSLRSMHLDVQILREILWIGFPAALQSIMNSLSGMVMTFAINSLGTAAMAGNTSYAKLDQIFWMISTAFSVSVSTFVGQNLGAGKKDRVKKGIGVCLGMDVLLSGFLSVFFLLFGHSLFYLFTSDSTVIASGMQVLKAIAPYYMLVAFFEITGSALRGMGIVIVPMILNITGLCGIRILWICAVLPALPALNSLYGIILSCPVSWVLTATAMMIYYFYKTRHSLS